MGSGGAGYGTAQTMSYDEVRMGPQVDMLADAAQYRLDDPASGCATTAGGADLCRPVSIGAKTDDPREPDARSICTSPAT